MENVFYKATNKNYNIYKFKRDNKQFVIKKERNIKKKEKKKKKQNTQIGAKMRASPVKANKRQTQNQSKHIQFDFLKKRKKQKK